MRKKMYMRKSNSCGKRRWRRFLALGLCGCISLSMYAGVLKSQVYLSVKNTTLKHALEQLQEQVGVSIIYSNNVLNDETVVSINSKNITLEEALHLLLVNQNCSYRVENGQVMLFSVEKAQPTVAIVEQEGVKIRGVVTDQNAETLPGVNVMVKGTTTGTITDINGVFEILAPYSKASLIFSYVGYQPKELMLEGKKEVKIALVEDSKALEEVVVVGYTTQKKATITGSISTITTKDLKQSPTANLNNALAGRMPGLMVNQFSGGEPGVDRADLNIRGMGTYGDKSPIVIVDGVERSMSFLAPEEIETFSILKDASATAPYGVRGANGVIIITTKRGKAQEKATVNFKASVGTSAPIKFPQYLGSADYATLYNEAMQNDHPGADQATLNLFSKDAIDNFRKAKGDNSDGMGYNWDYFDYAFKPGVQQDYSLSIRGGSDRVRYYIMANYFKQDGNYTHSNLSDYNTQAVFQRYNFRSNIDVDITKNFYAKLDLGARITDRNAPGTSASRLIELCNTQPSYLPIIVESNDHEGNTGYLSNNPLGMLYGDQIYRFNILGELARSGFLNEKATYLDGSFTLGHKLDFITEGLKAEVVFSYDAADERWIKRDVPTYSEGYREYPGYATFVPQSGRDIYMTPGHYEGAYQTGNKYDTDQPIRNEYKDAKMTARTYYQFKVDYMRSFGKHDVSGLILGNRSIKTINNEVAFCYQGITGRATYAYDSKYLGEFNIGYNGSENFAPGKRYGLFPAFSLGWVISREAFMSATNGWLDNLKIRGSYGTVGSDKVPNDKRFIYLQYYQGGDNIDFGTNEFGTGAGGGLKEGDLANTNLTWEKSEKLNIGIDAAFFNSQLTFSADYFREHRYDIITDLGGSDKMGFPGIVGKNAPYLNSGIVDNQGIDFEIGWMGHVGKHFRYWIKPNFTFARNKIQFMNEIDRAYDYRKGTGKRIDEHFVYVFDHFVNDQAEADRLNGMNNGAGFQPWGKLQPGDVVYKDLNKDGRVEDLGDRTAMGNPRTPEIQFGIPVGLQYKNFDFSMIFQGAASTSMKLEGAAVWDFPVFGQDKFGKVKPMHMNRWTEETKETATYPALHYGDYKNNKNSESSLFLYDASYLRLKNVEIGYTLPKSWIRPAGLQHVRIYAQGLNLMTWDGLDEVDMDPETREGSGDWYPVQRVFNFGIDITY